MSFELLVTYSGTDRPSDQNETTFPIMHCASQLFIHSGYFYFFFKSTILRGTPDTAWILCRSFTPKRHRQLRVKDFPKVPVWRLERDSNSRHFGRKATNLPMSRHAPLLFPATMN